MTIKTRDISNENYVRFITEVLQYLRKLYALDFPNTTVFIKNEIHGYENKLSRSDGFLGSKNISRKYICRHLDGLDGGRREDYDRD